MPAPKTMKFSVTEDDLAASNQGGGGEPAPPGFYTAEINSADYEEPEGKNKRFVVTYRIVDEETQYSLIWEYLVLTEASKWKMTQYLTAIGAITKAGDVDLMKVVPGSVGKKVRLRVVNETYQPAQGESRITAKPAGTWAVKGSGGGGGGRTTSSNGDRLAELQNMDEDELTEIEDEIRALAEPLGIDPDDINTWEEVVQLIAAGGGSNGQVQTAEIGQVTDEQPLDPADDRWHLILAMDEDELAEIADELEEYNDSNLDPNDYDTWEAYREALNDALNSNGVAETYEGWTAEELRTELKARSLDTKGGPATLTKRLQENDSQRGPFD